MTILSAHGLVDSKGEPCFAASGVSADDETTWIKLSDVLRQLKLRGAPGQFTLLVLDCVRHPPLIEAGQLQNEFADRVSDYVRANGGENLLVLMAAGPGERAWGAPSLEGSVFGHYLRLGLAGLADQESAVPDQRVTMQELMSYLRKHVDEWTIANRGAHQKPILVGRVEGRTLDPDGADKGLLDSIPLTCVLPADDLRNLSSIEEGAVGGVTSIRPEVSKKLASAWVLLDDLQKADLTASAMEWAALRRDLWRIELSLDAGPHYADKAEILLDQLLQHGAERLTEIQRNQTRTAELVAPASSVIPVGSYLSGAARRAGNPAEPNGDLEILMMESAKVESPRDARVVPWIRDRLKTASQLRRKAADLAISLSGSAERNRNDESTLSEIIAAARSEYQTIGEIGDEAAAAYALSDAWMMRLPSIVRWLQYGGPQSSSATTPTALREVARAVNELVQTLGSGPGDPENADASFSKLISNRERLRIAVGSDSPLKVSTLEAAVDEAYQRLSIKDVLEPGDVSPALGLLASGLLPTTGNGNPLEKRADLYRLLAKNPAPRAGDQNSGETEFTPSGNDRELTELITDLLECATRLRVEKHDSNSGELVRTTLRQFRQALAGSAASSAAVATPALWEVENAARASAAYLWQTHGAKPIQTRLLNEVNVLHLVRAETALEDFWGRTSPDGQPFYEQVADAELNAIRVDSKSVHDDAISRRRSQLTSKRQSLRRVSDHLVNLESVPVVDKGGLDELVARIRITRKSPATEAESGSLPNGSAVVILRDDARGTRGSQSITIDEKLTPSTVDVTLRMTPPHPGNGDDSFRSETAATEGKPGAATLYYRGHEAQTGLKFQSSSRTSTAWTPSPVDASRITVKTSSHQQQWVTFILDCSGSMKEAAPMEGQDLGTTRFEAARTALNQLLATLADRQEARVGVMLYGHRVGWSTKEAGQLLTQTANDGPIPDGLMPYADVESILPLGRFDQNSADRVRRRLSTVKPWGETPLYLAVTQAVEEMGRDDRDAQRTVIAITDGMNYQFNPTPDKARTADQVIRAAARAGTRVCIVGFGITQAEADASRRDFERIAEQTSGVYVDVRESQSLLSQLEEILGPRDFTLRDISGGGRIEKTAAGQAVDWKLANSRPQELELSTNSQRMKISLWGGEALDLRESLNGEGFQSAPYERGAVRFHRFVDGTEEVAAGRRLGVHTPRRERDRVDFLLSIQHEDARFVSRPREVWVEVTPLVGGTPLDGGSILFQDPSFLKNTPVPVLNLSAARWPKESRRARIAVWCRWDASTPAETISIASELASISRAPRDETVWKSVSDGSDALESQYRVKIVPGSPWRVDLIEKFPANSFPPLRIDASGSIRPIEIRRQFIPEAGLALHQFEFDQPIQLTPDDLELRLVNRVRFQRESIHLPQAVEVDVPPIAEALAPGLQTP